MVKDARAGQFSAREIGDRQVTQLIGISQGLIADDILSDDEVHFLHKWLVANTAVQSNPLLTNLVNRINEILEDNIIDDEEREELKQTLQSLVSNDFELGETLKSTTLPLCNPVPEVTFDGKIFCLTGTFAYGKRKDCEAAILERNGIVKGLTQKTNFLVIGEYATESWKQETFGRKIEQAVEMRDSGFPVSIISETHWREALT